MTRQEKAMISILFATMLISYFVLIMWMIKDIEETNRTFISDLLLGPVTGLVTGIYVTLYYRKQDKNERIAYASYGLYIHLRKISTRLDDLISDERNKDSAAWITDIEKLRETLIDEPYSVFLDLDDTSLGKEFRESRIPAARVITQLELMIVKDKMWPSLTEMAHLKSEIFQAEWKLLGLSRKFRTPKRRL